MGKSQQEVETVDAIGRALPRRHQHEKAAGKPELSFTYPQCPALLI